MPLIERNRQTGGDVDSRYNDGANDDESDVDNDDEEELVSISVQGDHVSPAASVNHRRA